MSYELTSNDKLIASMRGGLYDAEPPHTLTDEDQRSTLRRMLHTMNDLEIMCNMKFIMTDKKIIDTTTGIVVAERSSKDNAWVTVKGWQEARNNA